MADPPRLAYLYASPLVHQQSPGEKVPIPVLNTSSERQLLVEAVKESRRRIALRNEVATSDLRTLVTLGCRCTTRVRHAQLPGLRKRLW